jgi:hypothetical protein
MVRLLLLPSSGLKVLSTLKIEAVGSSETFVISSARCYIPEFHRCEDFKSDSTFWLRKEIIWESKRDYSLPKGIRYYRSIVCELETAWKEANHDLV